MLENGAASKVTQKTRKDRQLYKQNKTPKSREEGTSVRKEGEKQQTTKTMPWNQTAR